MQHAQDQIERINQKIQQLLKQHNSLQKINEQLRQEVITLKRQRDLQIVSMEDLHDQLIVLKAARSGLSDEEKKAFEKRLAQYIREIDRCITMLTE